MACQERMLLYLHTQCTNLAVTQQPDGRVTSRSWNTAHAFALRILNLSTFVFGSLWQAGYELHLLNMQSVSLPPVGPEDSNRKR